MTHAWAITEPEFAAASGKAYEGLFTLGSGYLHVRGSLEEHLADAPQGVEYTRRPANTTAEKFPTVKAKWGTYVPGVYDEHPTLRHELVNLPWFLGLAPIVDGERFDVEQCAIRDYARTLDMRAATLSRTLTWTTRSGATVRVVFERFISAARPHLCVQRMTLTADRPVRVTVRGGIDADTRTNGYDHLVSVAFERPLEDELTCVSTTRSGDVVTMRTHLVAPGAEWRLEEAGRGADLVADLAIPARGSLTVEKRTAVATSRDMDGADAVAILHEAAGQPYEMLHAEHAAIWTERWWASDVAISGDAEGQMAMRASLFHLLRCQVDDPRVAIDAKGYAGEAYRGHFFWDTEIYLLPFYLYTQPAQARVLTDFRLGTLPGAREMAGIYGYPGARYPWQTDTSGLNRGAMWQYGDHEVHVTADVAYGLLHYAKAADPTYLTTRAAEALVETARYWTARIDWRLGEDHPSLLGVMGPDEYTLLSSNNAYTNRLVTMNLLAAAEVGEAGGATAKEVAAFRRAAELPIPRRADGLVLQCEEFDLLAEPRFDERWPDRERVFAAQAPQELLYRTKCLKQADVLMLMLLCPDEFSDAEVRQAWDYYLPYTTHDSSLSAGAHAIVALRLGLCDEAWAFWQRTGGFDLDIAHGGAAEGIHIANCGASWQVAVLGFAGMRTAMQADVLTFDPKLPDQWQRLAFPVVWQGCPAYVEITPGCCTVANRGEGELRVVVAGEERVVQAEETGVWAV